MAEREGAERPDAGIAAKQTLPRRLHVSRGPRLRRVGLCEYRVMRRRIARPLAPPDRADRVSAWRRGGEIQKHGGEARVACERIAPLEVRRAVERGGKQRPEAF